MRIGIFDSGVGGLNVLKELIKEYPFHQYIYYGDTINIPYGDKTKKELLIIVNIVLKYLLDKEVDMIIIACGTISSNCYIEVKSLVNVPVFDIISPTIDYLNKTNYSKIGIIGTTRTIESNVFEERVKKNVICKKTPLLATIIERNLIVKKQNIIIDSIKDFKNNVDVLVLGCTHYSLINEIIKDNLKVDVIDMGKCLVNDQKIRSYMIKGQEKLDITLHFSKVNNILKENVNNILGQYNIKIV